MCSLIDDGKIAELLKLLESYKYKDKKLPLGTPNFYTYVENHKDCMDYPLYKRKGYFVGSGAIESGNIRLMQKQNETTGHEMEIGKRARNAIVIPASEKVFQIHWRSRAYTGDHLGKLYRSRV